MGEHRAVQQDIAVLAGVARSTVSLALRGHPKISPETRARIEQVARQLGYAPDPMLSALAAYRSRQRPAAFHGTLAWLVNSPAGSFQWERGPVFSAYFNGAAERAEFHGYRVETFVLQPPRLSAARVASILQARSISGILLCPQQKPETEMDFGWSDFSVVTFGYSLLRPALSTVASAHFLNTRQVVRRLAEHGYRRMGLVIDRSTDRRCGSTVYAGYLVEQALHPELARIPPFFDYDYEESRAAPAEYARKVARYIRRHRIDAILTSDHLILEALRATRIAVPERLGVAGLSLPPEHGDLSGIVEDSRRIGAIAVDMLVGMIQRGERGIPDIPIRTHFEGVWTEGRTLRRHPEAAKPRRPRAVA